MLYHSTPVYTPATYIAINFIFFHPIYSRIAILWQPQPALALMAIATNKTIILLCNITIIMHKETKSVSLHNTVNKSLCCSLLPCNDLLVQQVHTHC